MTTDSVTGGDQLAAGGQDGAESIVNDNLTRTGHIGGGAVTDVVTSPPGAPAAAALYIIGDSATGDFSGLDGQLAWSTDSGSTWNYATPKEGWRAHLQDDNTEVIYNGATWVKRGGVQTLTDAANITWDPAAGQTAQVTLTANRILDSPTTANMFPGWHYTVRIIQDGSGSHTLTWPSEVRWAGGSAPTLSTGAADIDVFVFHWDGTNLDEVAQRLNVS